MVLLRLRRFHLEMHRSRSNLEAYLSDFDRRDRQVRRPLALARNSGIHWVGCAGHPLPATISKEFPL